MCEFTKSGISKNSKGYLAILILTVFVVFWFKYFDSERKNRIIDIVGNHKYSKGTIIDSWIVGDSGAEIITYSYFVDSCKYSNSIPSLYYYQYFKSNKFECSKMRFWVIYSVDDPSKSLIDLSRKIQGIENPRTPGPKDLDSFE